MPSSDSQTTATQPDTRTPVALTEVQRQTLDTLCDAYIAAEAQHEAAQERFDAAKVALLAFVDRRGTIPNNADKSLRCEGTTYVATATRGTTVVLQDGYIAKLEQMLSRARRSHLFAQIFTRTVKYQLVKGAGDVLKSAKLPKAKREDILATFAQCVDAKTTAPRIVVLTHAALAKAAKKGGK